MNEQTSSQASQQDSGQSPSGTQAQPGELVVFSPSTLRWQLLRDRAMRYAMFVAVLVAFLAIIFWQGSNPVAAVVCVVLVIAGWIGLNLPSARISRQLPQLTGMIEADPPAAEQWLSEQLQRKPLVAWVRLTLYHRLAAVRHQQQRFGEAAAICAHVLQYPLGPGRAARPHLLLMLAESAINSGDLTTAYHALAELYTTRLSLTEALQRLALQTQYEMQAGYPNAAIARVHQKVQLAELMPAPQCAMLHVILASAADRTEQRDLAAWLWARAHLLCAPEQLAELAKHGYAPATT